METYDLEAVLSRVSPSARDKTASDKANETSKDPVEAARAEVSTAVEDLKSPAGKAVANAAARDDKTEKTAEALGVEKLAHELLDADADSMMKLAFTMGGAFEEGRLAQASVHAQAAHEIEEDHSRPKTAEEAQVLGYQDGIESLGAVIDAADHSYHAVMADREKLAAAVGERGYRQAQYLFQAAAKG